MSEKRVLLTGAGGFVGAVLVRRLLDLGMRLHLVVKPESNLWRLGDLLEHLTLHRVSLSCLDDLRRVSAQVRPEIIFHLAAHGAYPTQTDADGIIDTNILGTWNLLKATAEHDYEVFVNTGSSSEYGFKSFAMRETDLLEPNSYYSVAKCAQTLLCQYFARAEKRPVTTLRLFSVYGPYEEPSRLVPTLIRSCLNGTDLDLVSPETARDFVYVHDVVDAYLRLKELASATGEVINIGTGLQSTIRQVVQVVMQQTGAQVQCRWGSMPGRTWDAATWVADCTKARRLLGWQAATHLEEGLRQTVNWARQQASSGEVRSS